MPRLIKVLPLVALLQAPALLYAGVPRTEVAKLLQKAPHFDGDVVLVEGEVASVSYLPDIVDGRSLLSFQLSDGSGEVKVVNPAAGMMSRGDRVRVVGTFLAKRDIAGITHDVNEIDSTRGEVKVLSSKRADEVSKHREDGALAVPTTVVESWWSIAIGIATLLSAAFAATIPIILHSRRYNVGLLIVPIASRCETAPTSNERILLLLLRLVPTGSLVPQLARGETELQVRDLRLRPRTFSASGEEVDFASPLSVDSALTVELSFELPEALSPGTRSTCRVSFRDTLSSKRFSRTLHETGLPKFGAEVASEPGDKARSQDREQQDGKVSEESHSELAEALPKEIGKKKPESRRRPKRAAGKPTGPTLKSKADVDNSPIGAGERTAGKPKEKSKTARMSGGASVPPGEKSPRSRSSRTKKGRSHNSE